jgi:hypothetical protein
MPESEFGKKAMKSKRFRDIDGRTLSIAHEVGDERKPPNRLLAILVVVLVLGGSIVLLVSGLRAVLLTDSADAVVVGEVRTSCDQEACYHKADVEFVTASGQSVVTEAAVVKDALPGDLTRVYYYRDNPTVLASGRWLMVAWGAAPIGIGILVFLGGVLRWFKARRYTKVTRLDDRLPP